ncbi:MAG: hypothetical protein ABEK01_04340 [Candidatus Nanohaloarchaea archaeon]
MKKLGILIFLFVLLGASGLGVNTVDLVPDDFTVNYGEKLHVAFRCGRGGQYNPPSGCQSSNGEVKIAGETYSLNRGKIDVCGTPSYTACTGNNDYLYYYESKRTVPTGFNLYPGFFTAEAQSPSGISGRSARVWIKVPPGEILRVKGSMNDNPGTPSDEEDEIFRFRPQSEGSTGSISEFPGYVSLFELDVTNAFGNYQSMRLAETGKVLDGSYGTLNGFLFQDSDPATGDFDGSCGSYSGADKQTCQVAKKLSFTYQNSITGTNDCYKDCAPLHDYISGGFQPAHETSYVVNHEIVLGWAYGTGGPPNYGKPVPSQSFPGMNSIRFHVCDTQMQSYSQSSFFDISFNTGYGPDPNRPPTVYSPGGSTGQYQCINGKWQPVSLCNDGVDNDGDDKIDASTSYYQTEYKASPNYVDTSSYPSDDDCSGVGDNSEGECPTNIVGLRKANGNKVAFYSLSSSGSYTVKKPSKYNGCSYKYIDKKPPSGLPSTFVCESTDSYNTDLPARMEKFCNTRDDSSFSGHYNAGAVCSSNDKMKAAKYYISKPAVPLGPQYANSSGFDTVRYMTTHMAETKYDDWTGSSNSCENCHSISTWNGKNMEGTGGYASCTTDNFPYDDAWVAENATGMGDIRSLPSDTNVFGWNGSIEHTRVFDGGFAGNCPLDKYWMYNDSANQWMCADEKEAWEIDVHRVDHTSSSGKESTGFWIYPLAFKERTSPGDFNLSYWEVRKRAELSPERVTSVNATCYTGTSKPALDPATRNEKWFAVKVTGISANPSRPIPIWGKLKDTYPHSCEFTVKTSGGNSYTLGGKHVVQYSMKQGNIATAAYNRLQGLGGSLFPDLTITLSDLQTSNTKVAQRKWGDQANAWKNQLSASFDTSYTPP